MYLLSDLGSLLTEDCSLFVIVVIVRSRAILGVREEVCKEVHSKVCSKVCSAAGQCEQQALGR
jgi:hypothetical protein